MAKNNADFGNFLRDHVNINQSRLDGLHDRVKAVTKYLKNNLHGYQGMEPQGSLALRTIIKPVKEYDEFDADIQVVMNPNPASGSRRTIFRNCTTPSNRTRPMLTSWSSRPGA